MLDGDLGNGDSELTAKRFPTWGDTTDLVALLDVRPDGPLTFTCGAHSDGRRPVVEGSQMLGQAIVAAGRHAPERRVVSATMLFLRAADAGRPLRFELSELSVGRTFTGLAVEVLQEGRRCASGALLLDVTAPDVVRHAVAAPDVPGPLECAPLDMSVTGRDIRRHRRGLHRRCRRAGGTSDDRLLGPVPAAPRGSAAARRIAGAVHGPYADRHGAPSP